MDELETTILTVFWNDIWSALTVQESPTEAEYELVGRC
jgi:hypothetical protein